MATRMLVDARHPEETRVAVLKGNRIEEFDFESADRKQIKGNIYLAKVTRVEPSLQAAFVDFGGNRHGFLAFSEIHPDYYQIPKEDREALLAEEAEAAAEEAALRAGDPDEDDDDIDEESDEGNFDDGGLTEVDTSEKDQVATIEAGQDDSEDGDSEEASAEDEEESSQPRRGRRRQGKGRSKAADEVRAKRMALRRRYKIQDVIHRRQVLLVQVVKEERGNKGAALTTYLSLAGRYCVLMPNSSHGGGISRKINSASDRKRLKQIISELQLPRSMGCIVRTAGLQRTKTEIKRDFDYLARLWDELREKTLKSSAPTLIHSDSDLIKRAIRDIYNRDIQEVVVEGEDGYRAAKDFMKLLMPSHARRVKPYADPVPLFQRYGAEDQLTAMYDPVVQLRSGGYIVINPTEALVSIDINSGRSTKEHGIEATAVNTNIEAAHEIARQLRLRDMAGLVVIDFIDMEYGSNVRKVEKAMKDALKNDRARIQVGRISSFGLMEMSRQRLRTGVLEATTRACPHCDGTGLVRTASSAGLSALRLIEDEAAKGRGSVISLFASTEAAVYLLNAKRADLAEIESRYGVAVEVVPEGENEGAKMRVASSGPRVANPPTFEPIIDDDDDEEEIFDEDAEDESEDETSDNSGGSSRRRRRKRRRGGRGRDRRDEQSETDNESDDETGEDESSDDADSDDAARDETGDAPRKRRRRGGRRRRGRGRDNAEGTSQEDFDGSDDDREVGDAGEREQDEGAEGPAVTSVSEVAAAPEAMAAPASDDEAETAPAPEPAAEAAKPKRTRRKKAEEPSAEAGEETPKPKRTRRKKAETAEAAPDDAAATATAPADDAEAAPAKPKRTRRKKAEETPTAEAGETETKPKPKRTRRTKAATAPAEDAAQAETAEPETPAPTAEAAMIEPAVTQDEATPVAQAASANEDAEISASSEDETSTDKPRRGWWQRTFGD
ncbi:ribonuclease E/G [Novosphingobium sp. PC22D]|uniref:Rne/Rng family ribonuclease n=1 Tax=Novosphingobium sp. PC22D TaxID=1962403 RepID=UPI000BEFA42E|nr:ribonuclease E/G [Novosphingobium sp. PC22D]PEQ10649.1 ribonuclease E/G [Novosphingobium sp. PC22D]